MSFLKVGKADTIILQTANHSAVIDCGEEDDSKEILQFLSDNSISCIDYLFITHFDKDHVGGVANVLNGMKTEKIITPLYEGSVNKRRTTLKLDEAYSFVASGEKPQTEQYMNEQVLSEIEYFLHMYDLQPKLYLAYDRIAYFEKGNPDLRISFDMNIRSRRYDVRLDYGDYGEKLHLHQLLQCW